MFKLFEEKDTELKIIQVDFSRRNTLSNTLSERLTALTAGLWLRSSAVTGGAARPLVTLTLSLLFSQRTSELSIPFLFCC